MQYFSLTPAYGRTYTTKAQVYEAWDSGKDFVVHSFDGRSTYCNKADLPIGAKVQIHYGKRNEKSVVI